MGLTGFKGISDTYYIHEAGADRLCVRHSAAKCHQRGRLMTKSKMELIYCVMVVATAVVAGIVKYSGGAVCISCGDHLDP